MTTATAMSRPSAKRWGAARRWAPWAVLIVGAASLQALFANAEVFPARWDTTFSAPIDEFAAWAQRNRRSHLLFTGFFTPISDVVGWGLDGVEAFLSWIPWFVLPASVFAFVSRARDWSQATVAGLAMLYPGLVGLWDVTLETLALMTMAVLISVLIGVPLGIWGARSPSAERSMRPILDAMQTVPAPVYFIPMLLFFGVGPVPATIATVIYALPPVTRLTTLGMKEVPAASVEAAEMFGSTPWQSVVKVQLPLALPTILAGVTQTIMMALGIVVLATLLGAGGLGQEVMDALSISRSTGDGVGAGLAIVAIALVLDRIGRAASVTDRTRLRPLRQTLAIGAGLAIAVLAGRAGGRVAFPEVWDLGVFGPVDTFVDWVQDTFRTQTRWFNDFVVGEIYVPVRELLTETAAWPVLVFVTAWMGWMLKGPGLAAFGAIATTLIGLIGMWALSIDTLTQVLAAVLVASALAIPFGVWAGRNPRVERALGPILDALQTIPSLVYIIPAVSLFSIGVMPGIIASVLYAVVPGIRLTALGIKQVPSESVEASEVFGASPRQTMFGVRIPLAAPTIMAGVNQVIMMVLAMVIISGLVGGGALGFETVTAVKRSETGLGFEVGLAIVLIAMILDRFTQAAADRLAPPRSPA